MSEECPGEARVELARLDERIKAMDERIDRDEARTAERVALAKSEVERNLKLASDELARRLDTLNHAHAQAVAVQGTYVPRETFAEVEKRLSILELDGREQRGKLWLPMIAIAALAAGLAAAVVKLLIP